MNQQVGPPGLEGVNQLESSVFPSLHHRKEGNNAPLLTPWASICCRFAALGNRPSRLFSLPAAAECFVELNDTQQLIQADLR